MNKVILIFIMVFATTNSSPWNTYGREALSRNEVKEDIKYKLDEIQECFNVIISSDVNRMRAVEKEGNP